MSPTTNRRGDARGMHNARPVHEDGRLWCRGCEQFLQPEDFALEGRDRHGRSTRCRRCAKTKRDRLSNDANFDRYLRRVYGITEANHIAMWEAQGGRCAICQELHPRRRSEYINGLCVDHDHETGIVRGLLCRWCNTGIGLLRDDPEVIERAIAYLRR